MTKLLAVSAFYKNDIPGGIGVGITEEMASQPLEAIMDFVMSFWWDIWQDAEQAGTTDELVEDLIIQLTEIGKKRERRDRSRGTRDDFKEAMLVIGNVWLLERCGYIKPDEYNGCVFSAVGGSYEAIPPQLRP